MRQAWEVVNVTGFVIRRRHSGMPSARALPEAPPVGSLVFAFFHPTTQQKCTFLSPNPHKPKNILRNIDLR